MIFFCIRNASQQLYTLHAACEDLYAGKTQVRKEDRSLSFSPFVAKNANLPRQAPEKPMGKHSKNGRPFFLLDIIHTGVCAAQRPPRPSDGIRIHPWASAWDRYAGRELYILRHLFIKTIILPRQARDKHRENSQKRAFPHRHAGRECHVHSDSKGVCELYLEQCLFFLAPFSTKNDDVTKAGTGQTYGKS